MKRHFLSVLCLFAVVATAQEHLQIMTQAPKAKEVAKLLGARTDRKVDPQYLHLMAPHSFPGLLVVGEQVTTHSANLRAVVLWDEEMVKLGLANEMVAEAMARAGWAEADDGSRQALAMDWVRSVELEFAGSVQDRDMAIFGKDGRADFEPPTARSLPDSGVEVRLWLRAVERGKSSTRRFDLLRFVFTSEGHIAARTHEAGFNVPNQEWREAL